MVVKEVKKLCFELLTEKLIPLGYKKNKKEQAFTKTNEFGFDQVWFGTVEYAALKLYKLYFHIGVRIDKVQQLENLAHKFHDEDQQFKTLTCNLNCGTLIGQPKLEFDIYTPEDVKSAVETFWKIYEDYGVEHMKKCYDINFLNSIWKTYGLASKTNDLDSRDWLTVYGWYDKVLTIAYLADKDAFPAFRKQFTDYLVAEDMPENRLIEMNEFIDKISKSE